MSAKAMSTSGLETNLNNLFDRMACMNGDEPEYAAMADQVEKLYKLKEVDSKIDSGKRVSPDTWAVVAANLGGILMIVGHERANVVTSKALNFIMKLKS